MVRMEGHVCFITGGASGLGKATAQRFHKNGAKVVIADMNLRGAQKFAEELGSNALAVKCDVTKESDVKAAIDATMERFGRIDGVINCAGTGIPRRTLSKSGKVHPQRHFEKVIAINTFGSFCTLRLGAQQMLKHDPCPESKERGYIINVASVAAFDGQIGQAAYSASKAALVGMTLPIARDLGMHGIRICTIAPGVFATPMVEAMPMKVKQSLWKSVPFPNRFGQADEFAKMCQFIATTGYMNGETIRLDGGIRMPML